MVHGAKITQTGGIRVKMWQFLCDSIYDWIHRHDNFGQGDFEGWWLTRRVEFLRLIGRRSKDDCTYT